MPALTPPSSLCGLATQNVSTTRIYLEADLELKQKALDRTTPATTTPGRYRPPDQLIAFLEALCDYADILPTGTWLYQRRHPGCRHNPDVGIMNVIPISE